jgi:sugar diacid utilization regulator
MTGCSTGAIVRTRCFHYNTLANRLERIAAIVGPFVEDADRCLTLGLAIRLRRPPTG